LNFDIVSIILFLLPAYVSNSVPVIFGGGAPLDFGKKWSDGKYIFGKNKTIRGFISGVLGGTVVGISIAYLYPLGYFNSQFIQILASFMLSFGTMFGDALGSFIKRRMKIEEGNPFFMDSWFFILIAIILTIPLLNTNFYTVENILFILILTVLLHPLANKFANLFGLKKVPW